MEPQNKQIQYERAQRKVKQIKGFYIHLLIYILVNLMILILKFQKHENMEINSWGMGLWGIGVIIHGLRVFMPNFILGKNWEERKIKEIMEKEKQS